MSSITIRCYPPGGAATSSTVQSPFNGIVGYSAGANGAVDAAIGDSDSLKGVGWQIPDNVIASGTTAARPPAPGNKGRFYGDTTLGAYIWSDGAIWRNFAGAAA